MPTNGELEEVTMDGGAQFGRLSRTKFKKVQKADQLLKNPKQLISVPVLSGWGSSHCFARGS